MTESAAVGDLRHRLEGHLRDLFGGYQRAPDGDYVIPCGSSLTWVHPADWVGDRTVVRVWAITNTDVPVSPELARFLLNENATLVFGGFALDPERGAVGVGHSLLGDHLQRTELEIAIGMVAATADEYDDAIKARFGGRLFTETREAR